MLGAYVLAGELERSRGDPAAFDAYERRLRPFIERQQGNAVRFAGSFTPRTALGLLFRNGVLNLMRIGPLGAWYARHAFANTFPLPSYA
jgi:2-polyprenyl-6-methoxyphenol hydroxylase-like FAD-dependent oxidoreductase